MRGSRREAVAKADFHQEPLHDGARPRGGTGRSPKIDMHTRAPAAKGAGGGRGQKAVRGNGKVSEGGGTLAGGGQAGRRRLGRWGRGTGPETEGDRTVTGSSF